MHLKEGKNFKLWTARSDLAGDCLCALPILNHLEKLYPDSFKFWSVLRKIKQAAPFFFNHPLIDKIVISDRHDGFGATDKFYWDQCDVALNTRPQHPREQDWQNHRSVCEETFIM